VNLLFRFLVFNLLASLAGGLLAWLVVWAAVRGMGVRSSASSFCFFSLAVFKSLLLLLGLGLILPWPTEWFEAVHASALPPSLVLPYFLIWLGAVNLIFFFAGRDARRGALEDAHPAADAGPRLQAVFLPLVEEFRKNSCRECREDFCSVAVLGQTPRLMVSDRIRSPMVLTGEGEATVIFPHGLLSQLTESELAGALAHELAHLVLRRPVWCSAGTLQKMAWMVPAAGVVGGYLHRQEETTCDELAVRITGQPPDAYAGMLTKSYRFARGESNPRLNAWLQVLPRLVGFKPLLSERVEHLVGPESIGGAWRSSPWLVWTVWIILLALLLFHN
jgi:Zn-dependent protease with chaperone function